METEASRIVDSPTGTMERVLTEDRFDPESRAPAPRQGASCTYRVALGHERGSLQSILRSISFPSVQLLLIELPG